MIRLVVRLLSFLPSNWKETRENGLSSLDLIEKDEEANSFIAIHCRGLVHFTDGVSAKQLVVSRSLFPIEI